MIGRVLAAFAVFAASIAPLAGSSLTTAPAAPGVRSLHGYYLIEFLREAGNDLPFPAACLLFSRNGAWTSIHGGFLSGTYLVSGTDVFASALGQWSPTVYLTLQGAINNKGGSGKYIVAQSNGKIFSGGAFTMLREYSSGCS